MIQEAFTYRDGSQNSLYIYPSSKEPKELILIFPALGVRQTYYRRLAEGLSTSAPITVISCDWRAHGESSERPRRGLDYGYDTYVHDMDQVIDRVKEKWPGLRLSLLGHSLGGQIASLHMGRFGSKIDRLLLVAAAALSYKNWSPGFGWRVRMAGIFLPLLAEILGYYPGDKVGFGGREFKTLMKDWGHNTKKGEYHPLESTYDYEGAMASRKTDVRVITFEKDYWVSLKAARQLAHKFHPDSRVDFHSLQGFGHFDWARQPEDTLNLILSMD